MSQAPSPSTQRRYGLARVCRVWQLPRSTVYQRRQQAPIPVEARPQPRRRGPQGPCSDEALVEHIRRVLRESPFHGEGYRKVWAKLRFQQIRTSPERVRRLMREHGLQAPQRVGHPHGPKAHDGTISRLADRGALKWKITWPPPGDACRSGETHDASVRDRCYAVGGNTEGRGSSR
jgi:putative transposase